VPDSVINIVFGLFIGIIAGAVQFFLLMKFVFAVTSGKFSNRTVLFAITQFLFPFAILLICGFLFRDSLMWVGIGMASALIISAVIKFLLFPKDTKPKTKSQKRAEKKAGKKARK